MSNPYYNHTTVPATGASGSSSAIRAEFTGIQAGFALLQTPAGFAGKALTIDAGGTGFTTTGGSVVLAGPLSFTGAFNTTLALGASVTLTLPSTSGTIATLTGTETLTNKAIDNPTFSGTATGAAYNFALTTPAITGAITGTYTLYGSGTVTSPVLSGTVTGSYTIMNPVMGAATLTSPTFANTFALNGGQIAFPAVANPSATSTVMDDYEEGSWSPVLSCETVGNLSVAYSTQLGTYTKIGRAVFFSVYLITSTFTHTTASGKITVSLPFAPASASYQSAGQLLLSGDSLLAGKAGFSINIGNVAGTLFTISFNVEGAPGSIDILTIASHNTGTAMTIAASGCYFV